MTGKRDEAPLAGWEEEDSQTFIDNGRYFVPDREAQIEAICALIPACEEPFHVFELCCGEGLLAEAILARHGQATVHGFDGSETMLARAAKRLAPLNERFIPRRFDLADFDPSSEHWQRVAPQPLRAVASSLALHHLDGSGKQRLFAGIRRLLAPGGVFLIADLVAPATDAARVYAAAAWDEAVRRQARQIDGDEGAFARFEALEWNLYRHPDPIDQPSHLYDQLRWLHEVGFARADVMWMQAGHAVYGAWVA